MNVFPLLCVEYMREYKRFIFLLTDKTRHLDIGPSAYFAKLGKKKVNEEKEIEKHRK